MSETTSSYPFATARVKAMESKLITKDKLNRIIEAKDAGAAMHVLQEIGYGQPLSGKASFEQMIQHELDETDSLLLSISPNDIFTQIMRTEKDYYNLRVLIKLLMLNNSLEDADLSPGNIGVDTLRHAIIENNYYALPEAMKDALLYIDAQFAVSTDVSIVGIALDRAYAKQITELVEQMKDPLISEYFTAYFDLSNIISFMRVREAGHNRDLFERTYLKGGNIG
ncbi:MAG: V-type ATPase subunit, partial [Eubacteriales bacterium]|nr:V-type ATPase subunit [Eubacteriales bacterium]